MSTTSHITTRPANSPSLRPSNMITQAMSMRRPRPVNVQTTNITSHPATFYYSTIPPSAISSSSISSSPQNMSPIMFPETPAMTANSSVVPSPDPTRGSTSDDQIPYQQLPDSVLATKPSLSSLSQHAVGSPSLSQDPLGSGKSGLVRRFSNRATNLVTRRRQSSVAPNSREGSVGPAMVRKRSGSTATAPPDLNPVGTLPTDSDESLDDREDGPHDVPFKERHSNDSSSPGIDGPVWPTQLLTGTPLRKVSSKNRWKRIVLLLDPDFGRILWDSTKKKQIRIDDIKEIRTGSDTRQYCRDFDISDTEGTRLFSIIYAAPELQKTKTLHLIADDIGTFKNWTSTLQRVWQDRLENLTSLMAFDEKAIEKYWKSEVLLQSSCEDIGMTADNNGDLDFQGFERVCRSLHINASPADLLSRFHAADPTGTGRLDYAKFKEFVNLMKTRNDIADIYATHAKSSKDGLSSQEFLDFVTNVQGEDVEKDTAKWNAIYAEFADEGTGSVPNSKGAMSAAAFTRFLTSRYNTPIVETPKEITLDRPMNEYFISSSHNTYLLGRQVVGHSSIEGYISALVGGCRCVEVDCWDGNDGQPMVLHGRSMTTSISFQEVMTTIKRYAFVKSKYPLWISLEVHTNPTQQARMANIMKETFGDMLVTESLDPTVEKLPCPSELMERILIKVKKTYTREDPRPLEITGRRRGNSLTSPYTKPLVDNISSLPQSLPQSPLLYPLYSRRTAPRNKVDPITEGVSQERASSSGSSDEESVADVSIGSKPSDKRELRTERVLGDLAVYCAGVKFRGFDTPEAKTFNHIFSFMESTFSKYGKPREAKKLLDRHNMRYLMRVYPDRKRISSHNFDPLIYWRRGVQMAALNWQTFDLGMQLNRAMFEGGTDSTGYVLKPSELREIQHMRDGWIGKRERKTVSFSIDVISAQQLMRPSGMSTSKGFHPYIEVEVFHPNDKRYKNETDSLLATDTDTPLVHRTQIMPENGFNPRFDKRVSFKVTTKYPDLVFVRWSVKLSSDGESYNDRPPVATFMAKLANLKQGFRTIPLLNRIGEEYVFSTLFCHIKKDPITRILLDCPEDRQVTADSSGKFLSIGLGVFGRSSGSPRATIEKASSDSSLLI